MLSPDLIFVLIPSIIILILITLLIFAWYSGVFRDPDINTIKSPIQELEIAYKFVKGSYKDSSIVYSEAHSLIPYVRCIGVHYDNPDVGLQYSVRAAIGIILNDEGREVEHEERQSLVSKGFQITKFPEVENVVYTEFPHTSFFSVIIAMQKILPKFKEYIQARKLEAYPTLEICDGEVIIYLSPLSKQSEFFVYEALTESEEEITSNHGLEETEEVLEEIPDTLSSVDSLIESGSKVEDLPSNEAVIDSLEQKDKTPGTSSEASTESFEELQMDS